MTEKEGGSERNDSTHPTILESLLPALAALTNTNNDIQAIVTSVEALTVALRAVPNESKGIILEVLMELSQGPVAALIHDLLRSRKIERLHPAGLSTEQEWIPHPTFTYTPNTPNTQYTTHNTQHKGERSKVSEKKFVQGLLLVRYACLSRRHWE